MVAENAATTKIYYHLDDSTPYMSVVPVSSDRVTLGDFKKVFARRGYSYFCKKYDVHLKREVKVEITSDSQKLYKSENGLIELFLLSQANNNNVGMDASQNFAGTLPRAKKGLLANFTDLQKLNKRRSSLHALSSIVDDMDVGGGQRVSMVTTTVGVNDHRSMSGEASSDINTFISKRAGEHMAELYTSTSEDPYRFDGSVNGGGVPSFASSSNNYRQLLIPAAASTRYATNIDENDDGGGSSTLLQNYRHRKPRKQRYRKAYVPSTISSASESSLSFSLPRVEEVQLNLQDGLKLGISVGCHDGGIFISEIAPGSAADVCRQLEVGDQIVQIESISFENLSDEQAVGELCKASMLKRNITLYVAKRPRVSDQRSDALSLLCETMQMDVSLWVEQTTKQDQPFETDEVESSLLNPTVSTNFTDFFITNNNSNTTNKLPSRKRKDNQESEDGGAVTSDEERAAYADRRNGVGPLLVPALQQHKKRQQQQQQQAIFQHHHQKQQHLQQQQQPFNANKNNVTVGGILPTISTMMSAVPESASGMPPSSTTAFACQQPPQQQCFGAARTKNDLATSLIEPVNVGMDPLVILKRMARPDSGLIIKDRKWLKIPVPNSFIGDEMINWMMRNVEGFRDRKAAKCYASMLLAKGYIKHVVNMSNFNEKCYYIFEDSILAERQRILLQQQQQQQIFHQHSTLACTSGGLSKNSTNATRHHHGMTNGSAESTTEVTYMSSPSSPFLANITNNNSGGGGSTNNANNNILSQQQLSKQKILANAANNNNSNNNGSLGGTGGTTGMVMKVANNPRYVAAPNKQQAAMQLRADGLRLGNQDNHLQNAINNNNIVGGGASSHALVLNAPPPPLRANAAWPISPIFSGGRCGANNFNNNNVIVGIGSRDCDSPVTNDYASMIQGEINGGSHFEPFMDVGGTLKLSSSGNNNTNHNNENNPPSQQNVGGGSLAAVAPPTSTIPPTATAAPQQRHHHHHHLQTPNNNNNNNSGNLRT